MKRRGRRGRGKGVPRAFIIVKPIQNNIIAMISIARSLTSKEYTC